MKKSINFLIALATLLAFAFSGCEKDPTKPGEDENLHPMVWQYKYDQHQTTSDIIPAMDERGNIFFSIQNGEDVQDVFVFANDKDGNALWDKQYSSTNYVQVSRTMYIDNKVIYTVLVADELEYYQETIYCINAVDGTQIWQYSPDFNEERNITAMALTSQYLVVAARWGDDLASTLELHYFNTASGALVKSVDLGYDQISHISIAGNNIYLGAFFISSKSYSAPKVMKMDIESNEIYWTYNPDYENDIAYIFEQRNIAVDGNRKVFCMIRKANGVEPSNLYIVNDDGTLANTITSQEGNAGNYDILIDKDNNFYAAMPTFAKYSPDGGQIWEFQSGTTVPNSNFITGSILADNDTVYHAENGGILNVNTVGEIAWAKYDETNFTKPGYPLLTNEDNIVVVGDLLVSCIKGDGAKIQNAPWPRVFYNNGNTSSK